jgi:hypothetical protein
MKHIYPLFIAFFLLVVSVQAQVTIYHENMSDPVSGLFSSPAGDWALATFASTHPVSMSGGRAASTTTEFKTDGLRNKALTLSNNISTIGYKEIVLSWMDYRSSLNQGNSATLNGNPVSLFYSIDKGESFQEITGLNESVIFSRWVKKSIKLPEVVRNVEDLRLRWVIRNDNKHNDYYAIDDITITALPEEGIAALDFNTLAKNEDPFTVGKSYKIDGKTVTFTKAVPAGVDLVAKVTDSLFHAPIKTLTLIQKRATASMGSTITIKFDQPVTDLSFSLFDVDQVTGQFQDRILLTAKSDLGQTIVPGKNKVIHTVKNSFNTNGTILGVSGSDVAASSNEGDVRISFGVPVVEVTLAYYNSDAATTRAADGQQGIGIHNLTWRAVQVITPLPVELTTFKGQRNNQGVSLTWATASELDNKGFEVQTSTDGRNFKTVAFVESKVGTTLLAQNYGFTHKAPAAGTNYYRLRQVDFDGAFEFSKTIAIQYVPATASSVYPTMATEQVTVKLMHTDEQTTVLLTDMNGRQLLQLQNPTERVVTLSVGTLQQGIYFVTVLSGAHKETFRIMKR